MLVLNICFFRSSGIPIDIYCLWIRIILFMALKSSFFITAEITITFPCVLLAENLLPIMSRLTLNGVKLSDFVTHH